MKSINKFIFEKLKISSKSNINFEETNMFGTGTWENFESCFNDILTQNDIQLDESDAERIYPIFKYDDDVFLIKYVGPGFNLDSDNLFDSKFSKKLNKTDTIIFQQPKDDKKLKKLVFYNITEPFKFNKDTYQVFRFFVDPIEDTRHVEQQNYMFIKKC